MLPVEICRKCKAKIFYFGFRGNYFSIQIILEKCRIIITLFIIIIIIITIFIIIIIIITIFIIMIIIIIIIITIFIIIIIIIIIITIFIIIIIVVYKKLMLERCLSTLVCVLHPSSERW